MAAASLLLLGAAAWLALELSPRGPVSRGIEVLALSSAGRWIASGTAAGQVRIWHLGRPQTVREVHETNGHLNDLQFDPNEEYLAVANKNITLVPLLSPNPTRVIRGDQANYGTVRFTADGQSLLTINGRGAILAIEISTGKAHQKACCSTIYGEVALSPDDSLIFGAGHWPAVWSFRSGNLISRLTAAREFLAFAPIAIDGNKNLLYMGNQDGRVYVWDLRTRQFLHTSKAQPGYVRTIAVLGNSGWIAYAALGGAVRLWNPETEESRVVPAARTTSNLAFDHSHHRTALGTDSGQIELWDLIEGKLLSTLPPSDH
ncbi:MAG: hypothetical protein HY858_09975 [Candidatus Solibacter usitatus]|nr:hypothetical protein [Candidatus Solibacter usitatus]